MGLVAEARSNPGLRQCSIETVLAVAAVDVEHLHPTAKAMNLDRRCCYFPKRSARMELRPVAPIAVVSMTYPNYQMLGASGCSAGQRCYSDLPSLHFHHCDLIATNYPRFSEFADYRLHTMAPQDQMVYFPIQLDLASAIAVEMSQVQVANPCW